MAKASDFERAVKRARRNQLVLTNRASQRLDRILKAAGQDAAERLKKHIGDGSIEERYLAALTSDLARLIDGFMSDYSRLLTISLYGAAQGAADGQADVAQMVLDQIALDTFLQGMLPTMEKSVTINALGTIGVSFGHVAENAVEMIFRRVYKDGLNLSDRLWRLDSRIRRDIENTLIAGVAGQKSAKDLSRELMKYLTNPGADNAYYNAQRLARTEINHAHREGHIRSVTDRDGKLKDFVSAVGYRLSISHPEPDICDVWASQDIDGLGAGNYLPDNVPVDHPHGLCFTVTILKSYPDMQFVAKEPQPDQVPDKEQDRNSIKPSDLRANIKRSEQEIIQLQHERCHVFKADGTKVFTKDGQRSEIRFNDKELAGFKDTYFTHNHPVSGGSFSLDDIMLTIDYDLAQMRACGREYRHSMTRPAGGWGSSGEVRNKYLAENANVRADFTAKIAAGEMTLENAEKEHSHAVWQRVTKDLGIPYLRERW
jgi:hypothetical protein